MVVMSQDMLSYEAGLMPAFGWSKARARLEVILRVQNRALQNAAGAIFLTEYAARTIQQATGTLKRIAIINHGVDERFRWSEGQQPIRAPEERSVRCLYISHVAVYKHQYNVARAIRLVRESGHDMRILFVGSGRKSAERVLREELHKIDPLAEFSEWRGEVPHNEVPELLRGADIFIFASSCESMPVTLIEAMAAGVPIVCSDRGPMPEILGEGGVYFNPEDSNSIAHALLKVSKDARLRRSIAEAAMHRAADFRWERCAEETWRFLSRVAAESKAS